uniref:Putative ovule protein n=1 Tax=Solanum chacoense TaxID=4108 RepID=A0A0V0GR65_SOLCH
MVERCSLSTILPLASNHASYWVNSSLTFSRSLVRTSRIALQFHSTSSRACLILTSTSTSQSMAPFPDLSGITLSGG